jgi:hypothetical protein
VRKRGTAAVAGVAGARLQEAVNINLGLLSLKNVISHLHRKADYVPFSDNRLTELLRTIPFLSSPLLPFPVFNTLFISVSLGSARTLDVAVSVSAAPGYFDLACPRLILTLCSSACVFVLAFLLVVAARGVSCLWRLVAGESLGGRSKTVVVVAARLEPPNAAETLHALRFGERCRQISETVGAGGSTMATALALIESLNR